MKPRLDEWNFLKEFTHARVAMGRAGNAVPTQSWLAFKTAHARARESVWKEIDFQQLEDEIRSHGLASRQVQSQCKSKKEFLLEPDKGRRLCEESRNALQKSISGKDIYDCILLLGDGLSAEALHKNGIPFLTEFVEVQKRSGLKWGPLILARYARVALGDELAVLLKSKSIMTLIGERPGLASSESLSLYYTYQVGSQTTDADRNCISNIHSEGLSPRGAAQMAFYLLEQSFKKKLSGVNLKVEYPSSFSLPAAVDPSR